MKEEYASLKAKAGAATAKQEDERRTLIHEQQASTRGRAGGGGQEQVWSLPVPGGVHEYGVSALGRLFDGAGHALHQRVPTRGRITCHLVQMVFTNAYECM